VLEAIGEQFMARWGREDNGVIFVPGAERNPALMRWFARFQRALATPKAVAENLAAMAAIDGRSALASIKVPALVVTRQTLRLFPAAQARYMAEHIPGARYEELPGGDYAIVWEDAERLMQLIEEFVTGQRASHAHERRLATVLFTDIVDSTKHATKLGDAAWRAKLDAHDRAVHGAINQHRGRLVDSAGDGTLATFDAPGDAIDCAHSCHEAVAPLKLKLRAGLHIGELELREDSRVGGIAVHIAARVLGLAKAGDVLVSRTVRDVLIGSSYRFRERGIHELKGVPSKWPLYSVQPSSD
jgi:class 3 adenylate cyclase